MTYQRPLPSLVTLIDRHPEPEYAQFAEMQRPPEKESRVFPWIVLAALDSIYSANCPSHGFADCGTAACIGGWAEMLTLGHEATGNDLRAGTLLDLESDQTQLLFFCANWPAKFLCRYRDAKTPKGKARAAADRIEHFIATKGKE